MKTETLINNRETLIDNQSDSLTDSFREGYKEVLEDMEELEGIAMRLDKRAIDSVMYAALFDLHRNISTKLTKYFKLEEEYLFSELQSVLPQPSSTAVMIGDHLELLQLCSEVQACIGDHATIEGRKEELEAAILQLGDRLKRHIHKKEIMLRNGADLLLTPERQEKILSRLLN